MKKYSILVTAMLISSQISQSHSSPVNHTAEQLLKLSEPNRQFDQKEITNLCKKIKTSKEKIAAISLCARWATITLHQSDTNTQALKQTNKLLKILYSLQADAYFQNIDDIEDTTIQTELNIVAHLIQKTIDKYKKSQNSAQKGSCYRLQHIIGQQNYPKDTEIAQTDHTFCKFIR
ncbi:MAG: hypothetical protein CL947_04370 [Epsilonproteobacteria bacterium]|nr:hypothetical protein [Campylobacterota bacterium]|tara:strand:+ start:3054 stop:3581 length:528 start_codon:yes stop_codon:yes gene_type:complete